MRPVLGRSLIKFSLYRKNTLELCWLVVLKTECSQSCYFMSYRFPGRFESVKRKDSCSPSKLGNFIRDSLESQKKTKIP